jgi:SAM-dependent methyltransferase
MTGDSQSARERSRALEAKRRLYAKEAPKYDKEADFTERWLFGTEHRGWACSRAVGDTLEVAIGTGLNLSQYPTEVRLTGVDLSPDMLAVAQTSAERLGRSVRLIEGDAQPGGRLILVDHIRSSIRPLFWLQWLYEFIPRRTKGEYATRRPALHLMRSDFRIQARDRLRAGIIERPVAVKPGYARTEAT